MCGRFARHDTRRKPYELYRLPARRRISAALYDDRRGSATRGRL
jgi:hypothetical protein